MLECEGHKMFRGTVKITPIGKAPFDLKGTWYYNPIYNIWYCKQDSDGWTSSWCPKVMSDFREEE